MNASSRHLPGAVPAIVPGGVHRDEARDVDVPSNEPRQPEPQVAVTNVEASYLAGLYDAELDVRLEGVGRACELNAAPSTRPGRVDRGRGIDGARGERPVDETLLDPESHPVDVVEVGQRRDDLFQTAVRRRPAGELDRGDRVGDRERLDLVPGTTADS